MSSEVVIFDQYFNSNLAEISRQEAMRAGLIADVFTDAIKAANSVGFFTVSVVASAGPADLRHSPLQSAIWLELPHAVLQADQSPSIRERSFIRDPNCDILISRVSEESVIGSLRRWFESIRTPNT